ncbi:MAG: M1 family peptidase, partial [Bacteroidota bacterium]
MKPFLYAIALFATTICQAQKATYTSDDTLRGSVTPQRSWWDLTYYDLNISVVPDKENISGFNTIHYIVLEPGQVLQVDLQPPLKIERVEQDGKTLGFEKAGRFACFVKLEKPQR